MRGTLAPGGDMWRLAVDGLLVKLVDTHLQVGLAGLALGWPAAGALVQPMVVVMLGDAW